MANKKDRYGEARALTSFSTEECDVVVGVGEDMQYVILNNQSANEVQSPMYDLNEIQKSLMTELVVLHEIGHCKLYEIKDVFIASTQEGSDYLNTYHSFAKTTIKTHVYENGEEKTITQASIHDVLGENFADLFGAVHLIKKHGPTKDVLKLLKKWQIERSLNAFEGNKKGFIPHNTEFSFLEILKKDNIQKILEIQNDTELNQFILKIANDSMWKSLKMYGMESAPSLSVRTIVPTVKVILYNIYKKDSNIDGGVNNNLPLKNNLLWNFSEEIRTEIDKKIIENNIDSNDYLSIVKLIDDTVDEEDITSKVLENYDHQVYRNLRMEILKNPIERYKNKEDIIAKYQPGLDSIPLLANQFKSSNSMDSIVMKPISLVMNKIEDMRRKVEKQNNSVKISYNS